MSHGRRPETLVAAACRYPGGTHLAADIVGYRRAENAARPLAIPALLLLCVRAFYDRLPVLQKVGTVAGVGWLFAIYYRGEQLAC